MSSKRAIRRKACGKKQRYPDQQAAQNAVSALRRRAGEIGQLTTYHCQFCGGFHFGHPPRKVRDAINNRMRKA